MHILITSFLIVQFILSPVINNPQAHVYRTPVLVYHHVDNHAGRWYVPVKKFEEQLKWLSDNGYHTASMDDYITALQAGQQLPAKTIVLTFDDGYADAYTNVFPLLQEYGFTGTFFVVTGYVGTPNYLSWDEITEMQTAGMEIGAHTVHHPFLTKLSANKMIYEVQQSRIDLENHLAKGPTVFAYPYNDHNKAVIDVVRQSGFRGAVIVGPHRGDNLNDLFEIPRITILPGERLRIFELVAAGMI
jgi:peptidoglycan/xylan/chitin deacetylase (PgdA/CDA1 family)